MQPTAKQSSAKQIQMMKFPEIKGIHDTRIKAAIKLIHTILTHSIKYNICLDKERKDKRHKKFSPKCRMQTELLSKGHNRNRQF